MKAVNPIHGIRDDPVAPDSGIRLESMSYGMSADQHTETNSFNSFVTFILTGLNHGALKANPILGQNVKLASQTGIANQTNHALKKQNRTFSIAVRGVGVALSAYPEDRRSDESTAVHNSLTPQSNAQPIRQLWANRGTLMAMLCTGVVVVAI